MMAETRRAAHAESRRKQRLDQVTAWVDPHLQVKQRMDRIRAIDHRQTYSRIAEDAILQYLPQLERRFLPYEDAPPLRRTAHGA